MLVDCRFIEMKSRLNGDLLGQSDLHVHETNFDSTGKSGGQGGRGGLLGRGQSGTPSELDLQGRRSRGTRGLDEGRDRGGQPDCDLPDVSDACFVVVDTRKKGLVFNAAGVVDNIGEGWGCPWQEGSEWLAESTSSGVVRPTCCVDPVKVASGPGDLALPSSARPSTPAAAAVLGLAGEDSVTEPGDAGKTDLVGVDAAGAALVGALEGYCVAGAVGAARKVPR